MNVPQDLTIRVGDTDVTPSKSVRNLGVVMDRTLSMEQQVHSVTRSCYAQLRNIGQIRRFLTPDATKSLTHGLVTSRFDYCNALLHDIPNTLKSLLLLQATVSYFA